MFPQHTKILVIDDMKTMRLVVKRTLNSLGFNDLTEAENGEIAWGLLTQAVTAQKPFDLVVSDWTMPQMSGLDLLKKVRADKTLANTPFLMVTAESDAEQVKKAVLAGVSHYVTKPFTAETIKTKLQAMWQKHGKKAA